MTTATRTTADVLREMRELLAEPEAWTRGWFARDAAGEHVDVRDPKATCWCLAGAGLRAGGLGLVSSLLMEIAGNFIDRWNDAPDRTHAEVLDLLDRAIGAAS